ncbi:MAG TPA: 16S rRNA (guanine(966)-N(2))-methyltransferase RsmD [Chloroflexota bacterium]
MRVVAGAAKGHRLQAPKGSETRPTSDKVREAIFDVLRDSFVDEPVLDLFAGTGALGIEALSRGASNAVFVERRPQACATIRANLAHTRLVVQSQILCMPVERAIPTLDQEFSLVLLDPPYAYPRIHDILVMIGEARVVGQDTIVVLEHSPRFAVAERYARLVLQRQKTYGDTTVSFFAVQEEQNT